MIFIGQQHIQTLDIVTLKNKLNRNKGLYYIDSFLMIQQLVEKMKDDKGRNEDLTLGINGSKDQIDNKTC